MKQSNRLLPISSVGRSSCRSSHVASPRSLLSRPAQLHLPSHSRPPYCSRDISSCPTALCCDCAAGPQPLHIHSPMHACQFNHMIRAPRLPNGRSEEDVSPTKGEVPCMDWDKGSILGGCKTVTAHPRARRQAMPRAAPLRWRCGAALRQLLFPSGPEPTCRRLGASLVAGRPTPAVPNGDACAWMAASPRAAPLTLRSTSNTFLITIRKLGKGADAVSEGPSASGRTSPRSRCLALRPPAPACRAGPNTFRIWGFQEGGAKNGDGNAADWPQSRLFE